MMITRVKVSNFKSFDHLEVELRPLNIVVGSNAAGKSNFLGIFRFIRDLAVEGTENAISLQGGMEYLLNLQIGPTRPVTLEITFLAGSPPREFTYSIEITQKFNQLGFEVISEKLTPYPTGPTSTRNFLDALIASKIATFDVDPSLPKKSAPISGRAQLESDGSNLALALRNLLQDSKKRVTFLRLVQDALPFIENLSVEHF